VSVYVFACANNRVYDCVRISVCANVCVLMYV
jgi:hypothetical protein